MSDSKLTIPPDFDSLPSEQRIAYVQELWDRIARDPEKVPVPEHHKAILKERLDAFRANPKAGTPWSVLRDELLDKLQRN